MIFSENRFPLFGNALFGLQHGRMRHDRFEIDARFCELQKIGPRTAQRGNGGEGLLQRFGRVKQITIAAEPAGDLKSERHPTLIDAARQGYRRVSHQRHVIGQREPVVIRVQLLAFEDST